jgi:antitoxin HicB
MVGMGLNMDTASRLNHPLAGRMNVDRVAKETIYKLPLVLEAQPEGGYTVTCPLLPELITEGDTVRDALTNAEDALAAVLEAFEELGRPLPSFVQPVAPGAPIWLEMAVAA